MHRDAFQLCSITHYMLTQLDTQVLFVAEYFRALKGSHSALKCILHPLYCKVHFRYCSAVHSSNYIAVHRQELATPLTQCRLNTTNYV